VIKVGVALLPEVDPAHDQRWLRVEAYGFAHAWSLDHLAWRAFADSTWYATVPALTAAALRTSRLNLGTFVASPNFRHPVPFAKELMTLDVMSGGRLVIGAGAGGPGYDAAALGGPQLSRRERADRFTEFVTLLDLLLRQRSTTWSGDWFSAVEARMFPGPVQQPRPPLVIAGNGPRGMRLALRTGDGWATNGVAEPPGAGQGGDKWWRGVAEAARRLDTAAEPDGAPDGFRRLLDMAFGIGAPQSLEQMRDHLGHAAELGFTDAVIGWPRAEDPLRGSEVVLAELGALLVDGGLAP
jgi:alkanesulfonate monooxygenase SsuD/methylene tetrahydromethanopterin reductase-like flavin-dependent oxidoreductase (luciferase family)